MTIMQTVSGRQINLVQPSPTVITIRDIAHHLALLNRFAGATALPYSVAQHSTVVAKIAEQVEDDPLVALQALLHDAPEYLTGDIITPMQEALSSGREQFKLVESAILTTIHEALGVPMPGFKVSGTIRFADRKAFATEWRDLMAGRCPVDHGSPANFPIKPIPWHAAEEKFLKEFDRLSMMAGIRPPKIPPYDISCNDA